MTTTNTIKIKGETLNSAQEMQVRSGLTRYAKSDISSLELFILHVIELVGKLFAFLIEEKNYVQDYTIQRSDDKTLVEVEIKSLGKGTIAGIKMILGQWYKEEVVIKIAKVNTISVFVMRLCFSALCLSNKVSFSQIECPKS